MKVYEVTFADPEVGFVRQWKRNKTEIKKLISEWSKSHPLRKHFQTKQVEVPTDKTAFIDWLNTHANRPTAVSNEQA